MLDCPNSENVFHISSQNLSCFNLCPLYFKLKLMVSFFLIPEKRTSSTSKKYLQEWTPTRNLSDDCHFHPKIGSQDKEKEESIVLFSVCCIITQWFYNSSMNVSNVGFESSKNCSHVLHDNDINKLWNSCWQRDHNSRQYPKYSLHDLCCSFPIKYGIILTDWLCNLRKQNIRWHLMEILVPKLRK